MQVGDLVRYKRWPEGSIACEGDAFNGYGIVLKKNNDGYILMRFFDVTIPSEFWEDENLLEGVCK